MATRAFPFGQSAIYGGNFTPVSDTMTCYLVATGTGGVDGYAYNTAHSALANVNTGARASHGTANLANKLTSASGSANIFTCDTVAIAQASANADHSVFHACVYVKSGTTEGNSFLYSYQDLTTPVTANGGGVNVSHTGLTFEWM